MSAPKFVLILLPFLFIAALAQDGKQDGKQDVAQKEAQNEAGDGIRLSTVDDLKSEFASVPCKNDERQNAVKALFERLGADPAEVTIDKYKHVENVVINKPGVSPDAAKQKIVIGAHYDKVDRGCGAIDNWTGIVTLAHIYRTLKNAKLKKTLLFVAFGKEEKGLVGSTAMTDAIKKEENAEFCAMINIDSLGLGIPQVADNMSSKKMVELSVSAAQEMKMHFSHQNVAGGDSDSSSFVRKKIPALTIHSLTSDWTKILHTDNDQAAKVDGESMYLGYRLALYLLARIDSSDCQALREK